DPGVEVLAAQAKNLGHGGLEGPRLLVGADVGEGVEHVRHGDDPPARRYPLAAQAARVAGAVPALVVVERDLLPGAQHDRAAAGEDARPDRRVPAHQLALPPVEAPGAQEDAVRDPELADVV